MKHVITLMFFIAFFTLTGNAQNEKLDFVINQFCKDLNPEGIKKMSPEEMQSKLLQIGIETRKNYLSDVNEIFLDLKKENPNLSDSEINRIYSREMIFRALDICPEYKELALMPLGNCPKENKTLKKLLQEVEKVIKDNENKEFSELNELVVNSISTTIFGIRSQVEKDYKDGIANPQLISDMNNYLFHKSPVFLKIAVSQQIDKAFNKN